MNQFLLIACLFISLLNSPLSFADELLMLENSIVKVGINRDKGGAITWLSSKGYPKNIVNLADPGRLIQQSYYAGKMLDRKSEGQHSAWSPWTWNPIQGGGVGSWARVTQFKKIDNGKTIYSETVPKLWDMPNEEASALMKQWISFEPSMPNTIVVKCEFISLRKRSDRWGKAVARHQEIPACYFTSNFQIAKTYLGNNQWKIENQPPGPPWGKTKPPKKAMAFFTKNGEGVGVFSPASIEIWNFGPHGQVISDDPKAGPCMHVAPLDLVKLKYNSVYRFRYWLTLGSEAKITESVNSLWKLYSKERSEKISQ